MWRGVDGDDCADFPVTIDNIIKPVVKAEEETR